MILVVTRNVIITRRNDSFTPLQNLEVDESNPEFGILEDNALDSKYDDRELPIKYNALLLYAICFCHEIQAEIQEIRFYILYDLF